MKTTSLTSLCVILMACGLGGCADGGGSAASDDTDASAGANGTDEPNGSGGTTAGVSGKAGSAGSGAAGAAPTQPADPGRPYDVESFKYQDPNPGKHPLSQNVTTLERREEILVVNPSRVNYATNTGGWLIDDAKHGRAVPSSHLLAKTFDGEQIWDVARVELDGDQVPEVAVAGLFEVSHDPVYGVAKDHLRITLLGKPGAAAQTLDLGAAGESFLRASLSAGDVDGDGEQEIIVAAVLGERSLRVNGTDAAAGVSTGARLYVVDRTPSGLQVTHTKDFAGATNLSIAALNLDADSGAELGALTTNATQTTIDVLDDVDTGLTRLGGTTEAANGAAEGFLVAGSFDAAAGTDLAWLQASPQGMSVRLYDATSHAFASNTVALEPGETWPTDTEMALNPWTDAAGTTPREAQRNLTVVAADVTGDGIDELGVLHRETVIDPHSSQPWLPPTIVGERWNLRIVDPKTGELGAFGVGDNGLAHLASVNDDNDAAQELVVSRSATSGSVGPAYYVYDHSPQPVGTAPRLEQVSTTGSDIWDLRDGRGVPFVAGGDFDADNMVVRYTGKNKIALAQPMILVALAAPPVQTDIGQNLDGSETRFGTDVTNTQSNSNEVSGSLGVSLSFEAEAPLGLFSVEMSASLEAEFTKTQTTTHSITDGKSYGTGPDQDAVVFLGSLYHLYTYEIVVAATADDGSTPVGTEVDIQVPVDSHIYKWDTARFNRTFADPNLQIGSETFSHTPLDVKSYPDAAKRDALKPMVRVKDPLTVGSIAAADEMSLAVSNETATATSYSLSVTFEAGVAVGGVGVSASAGFGTSQSVELSIANTATYSSSIGGIVGESWDTYHYSTGLFVHDVKRGNDSKYRVINYWVEDLGPGY